MPPVRPSRFRTAAVSPLIALIALVAAGCGSSGDPATDGSTAAAPAASEFPAAGGGTLEDLLSQSEPSDNIVVAPTTSVFVQGRNRFGFGVFTVDRTQLTDAKVAIYIAHGPTGKAEGPFPARLESLETDPAFTAQTTANDPDAAKAVYVTDLQLDKPGEWRMVAVVKRDGATNAVRMPSIVVSTPSEDVIPEVGEKAPVIHTPTVDDVADVTQIDTRIPPDDMHDVDFADVVGKKPVVLMFATPALCQSRVCGPVVDVADQVKRDHNGGAAFIHMEIYNQNDPNKGLRPQVNAFHLRTEPWTFVLNSDGTISSRIEGALSVDELEQAVDRAK
ncbi:MAG: hypothetical protein QOI10_2163 [Solirubrobacterales bacterium]|jgi:hypothetical protein|nr:hypothetical protein [Solirubrobacterales bacterium]